MVLGHVQTNMFLSSYIETNQVENVLSVYQAFELLL